ncbi:g8911 [Coccomyxa elongata]
MQKAAGKTAAPKTATTVAQPRTPGVTQLPGIPEDRTLPVQQADPGPSEADPAAAESSDSPQWSVNTHDGDQFELGALPFVVWSRLERNVPLAGYQEVMLPRSPEPGIQITLPMLVRAFAEHPTEHFFSRSRGAHFTAHQVCILTSMVNELADVMRSATSGLASIGARLQTTQQEILEN